MAKQVLRNKNINLKHSHYGRKMPHGYIGTGRLRKVDGRFCVAYGEIFKWLIAPGEKAYYGEEQMFNTKLF